MNVLRLVCAGLFVTAGAGAGAESAALEPQLSPKAAALAEYKALKAKAGNKAEDHVRLALWCESQGLQAERLGHLAKAMLIEPGNGLARGLAGLVQFRGRWLTPMAVGEAARENPQDAAALAEYNARRAPIDQRVADDEAKADKIRKQGNPAKAYVLLARSRHAVAKDRLELGLWCEKAGLKGEAEAELVTATQLDPKLDLAWKYLGFVRINGRWVSSNQIAADKAEAKAQADANAHWAPLLRKWKGWLKEKGRRDEAIKQLDEVNDPRAIPAVVRVLGDGSEDQQQWAVRIFDRIETPDSSRALAMLAVFSPSESIRERAIAILKRRPANDYVEMLVGMIRSPTTYTVNNPQLAPGTRGVLVVNAPRFQIEISYEAPAPFVLDESFRGVVLYGSDGRPLSAITGMQMDAASFAVRNTSPSVLLRPENLLSFRSPEPNSMALINQANLKSQAAKEALASDIQTVEQTNTQIRLSNHLIGNALKELVDAPDLKDDEDGWNRWWYDKAGYEYTPPEKVYVYQEVPSIPPPVLQSCFVAGTAVRTMNGPRPIEAIRPGERVLSQNIETGSLDFQPVTTVYHNPPIKTVRLTLDNGESIVPSIYHRFWIAGKGWALARDLKAGDVLRSLDGLLKVATVEAGATVPVFNLDVARNHTYYVGNHDALVHDNTPPGPVARPFDALAEPTAR